MTDPNATEAPRSRADVVLVGRLGTKVDRRTLPSGDEVTIFTVVVDRPRRRLGRAVSTTSATVDAIACQTFRVAEARRVTALEPGAWVRVEGSLRRRFWRAGTGLGSAMEVEVASIRRYP
jgi:single-strand DNA-binding protein